MKKEIFVRFSLEDTEEIKISYKITETKKMHHIECTVENTPQENSWLQMHKFNFSSLISKGKYDLLFDDLKFNKNLSTILFIDQVYLEIMNKNSLKIA
jgi:hypothetical protein